MTLSPAKLVTQIVADITQFSRNIEKAKLEAGSLTKSIAIGAATATAAFTALSGAAALVTREIFQSANKISTLADDVKKLGSSLAVSSFQELAIAARDAGVSTEQLQNLLGLMNKKLGEAKLSGTGSATALRALGLSLKEMEGLSTDQRFDLIAKKMKNIQDVTVQSAIASDLFGKNGRQAIALFNSNIDETTKKVRTLGITLTDSQAEALDKLSENKDLIGSMWEGFKDNVSAEVAPAFNKLFEGIIKSVQEMGGLKNAAKTVADYIIDAMHKMEVAIKQAGTAIQFFKNMGGGSLFSQIDKFLTYITSPIKKLIVANTTRPDMGTSRAKEITSEDWASMKKKADEIKNNQQNDATARALAVYNSETKKATDAIKAMKEQAMQAAGVLDKFSAIKDAFAAPGKAQASGIIKDAVEGLGIQLAPSQEFTSLIQDALKNPNGPKTGDILQKLESIIAKEGSQNAYVLHENESGFRSEDTGMKQDVSGLVTALNELKSFLSSKGKTQDQKVEVKIKVEASNDFVTNITTSQSFREAVDKEFDERTAQAARGNIP